MLCLFATVSKSKLLQSRLEHRAQSFGVALVFCLFGAMVQRLAGLTMQLNSITIRARSGRAYTIDTRRMKHARLFALDLIKRGVNVLWLQFA
jgi:hypothetical protein